MLRNIQNHEGQGPFTSTTRGRSDQELPTQTRRALIAFVALTGSAATANAAPVRNETPQEIINGFFQGIECGLNRHNPLFQGNPECPRQVLVYQTTHRDIYDCRAHGRYLVKRYRNADSYTCSRTSDGKQRLRVYDHKW